MAKRETTSQPGPPQWGAERRLTMAQAREIRRRNAAGESQRQLAREFPVSQQAISDIINGKTYKEE